MPIDTNLKQEGGRFRLCRFIWFTDRPGDIGFEHTCGLQSKHDGFCVCGCGEVIQRVCI